MTTDTTPTAVPDLNARRIILAYLGITGVVLVLLMAVLL